MIDTFCCVYLSSLFLSLLTTLVVFRLLGNQYLNVLWRLAVISRSYKNLRLGNIGKFSFGNRTLHQLNKPSKAIKP